MKNNIEESKAQIASGKLKQIEKALKTHLATLNPDIQKFDQESKRLAQANLELEQPLQELAQANLNRLQTLPNTPSHLKDLYNYIFSYGNGDNIWRQTGSFYTKFFRVEDSSKYHNFIDQHHHMLLNTEHKYLNQLLQVIPSLAFQSHFYPTNDGSGDKLLSLRVSDTDYRDIISLVILAKKEPGIIILSNSGAAAKLNSISSNSTEALHAEIQPSFQNTSINFILLKEAIFSSDRAHGGWKKASPANNKYQKTLFIDEVSISNYCTFYSGKKSSLLKEAKGYLDELRKTIPSLKIFGLDGIWLMALNLGYQQFLIANVHKDDYKNIILPTTQQTSDSKTAPLVTDVHESTTSSFNPSLSPNNNTNTRYYGGRQ
jgi:hypothetical protein